MTEHEKMMDVCSHVWIYDHCDHDVVYMRCPRCQMLRFAMSGEPCHLISQELKIRHDGEEGDC